MSEAETKIIHATIECIEEYGIQATTIRKIGERAGMNSASINYYFRSKDVLIERTLALTLDNAFRWEDFAHTFALPLREQLVEVFGFLAVQAMRFPGIAQAHLYEIFMNRDYNGPTTARLNSFLTQVEAEVQRKRPAMPHEVCRFALTQIAMTAFIYLPAFPFVFEGFAKIDIGNDIIRKAYITQLIDVYFKE